MALVKSGKDVCSLCGKTLDESDEVVGFPAFLQPTHKLARYSDAAFHAACFGKCEDREAVEALYRRYREIWDNRPNLESLEEMEAWGKDAFKEFA